METWLAVHAGTTWALVGLVWLVQVVHYPLFARVPAEGFVAYEAAHVRRMTWVVAPLMVAEAVGAGALVVLAPPGVSALAAWVGAGLVALVWLVTALVQVPLHARLATGFSARTHAALVRTNWIRTAAWTARGGLCVLLLGEGP